MVVVNMVEGLAEARTWITHGAELGWNDGDNAQPGYAAAPPRDERATDEEPDGVGWTVYDVHDSPSRGGLAGASSQPNLARSRDPSPSRSAAGELPSPDDVASSMVKSLGHGFSRYRDCLVANNIGHGRLRRTRTKDLVDANIRNFDDLKSVSAHLRSIMSEADAKARRRSAASHRSSARAPC